MQKCGTAEAERRPVWFVFAGMGTQWSGMGRDLMTLDVFKESIMRSDAVLQPLGVKLYDLLMESTADTFNDTLNSFISIAAIQVVFLAFCCEKFNFLASGLLIDLASGIYIINCYKMLSIDPLL